MARTNALHRTGPLVRQYEATKKVVIETAQQTLNQTEDLDKLGERAALLQHQAGRFSKQQPEDYNPRNCCTLL